MPETNNINQSLNELEEELNNLKSASDLISEANTAEGI